MLLADYIQLAQDALHDPNGRFYSTAQLTRWINRARKKVAQEGQCVRIQSPSTASISSCAVNSGGSGYTTATVTFSAPDGTGNSYTTATGSATVAAGQVTAVTVLTAGSGYVASATATITGDGTGAMATPVLSPHNATVVGQELYQLATFSGIAASLVPGLGGIIGVQNISVSWGAYKPTLDRLDYGSFQAYLRSVPAGYQSWPRVWAQYGQGETGSLYLWPVPIQVTQMDVDAFFDVVDLVGTTIPDMIPEPWSQAVVDWATALAYRNAQRPDDSRGAQADFDASMMRARAVVQTAMVPTYYPSS